MSAQKSIVLTTCFLACLMLLTPRIPACAEDVLPPILPDPKPESPIPTNDTPTQDPQPFKPPPSPKTIQKNTQALPFLHYGLGLSFEGLVKSETFGYSGIDPSYQEPFLISLPVFIEGVIANGLGLHFEVLLDTGVLNFEKEVYSTDRLTYAFYYKMYFSRLFRPAPSRPTPNPNPKKLKPQDDPKPTPSPKKSAQILQSFALGGFYRKHPKTFYQAHYQGETIGLNRHSYGFMANAYIQPFLVIIGIGKEYIHPVDSHYNDLINTSAYTLIGYINFYYAFSLISTLFSKKPTPPTPK